MAIQVTDTICVDFGKVRKRAIATEELLSDDVTASHYKLVMGKDAKGEDVPGRGADGEVIKLGEEMEYLDHRSKTLEWVVYQNDGDRYQPVSRHPSEEEAVAAAEQLAGEAG